MKIKWWILGIGIPLVIGVIIVILWTVGIFTPPSLPPGKPPTGKKIFNTYILSPNDTWVYWDTHGDQIKGTDNQRLVKDIFAIQKNEEKVEFGITRVLIFLMPGRYKNLHIQVGYYTTIAGLGETAEATVVQGTIESPNDTDPCIGALYNHYRNISNLTIEVDTTTLYSDDLTDPGAPILSDKTLRQKHTNYFRVSKGSPIRNIRVRAGLRGHQANFAVSQFSGGCKTLDSGGYASGGFMANVKIRDGECRLGTQQQYFSRNCEYNVRSSLSGGGVWNIYLLGLLGSTGKTAGSRQILVSKVNHCPPLWTKDVKHDKEKYPPLITLKHATPGLMAAIPQINYNSDTHTFYIAKPALFKDPIGFMTTKEIKDEILSNVFIVNSYTSIQTINKKLAEGVHLIFSPLVYHFDEPVRITQSETVVITLGYATIIPTAGLPAIVIGSDTEGVRLSGFILQAGKKKSEALLLVGKNPREGGSETNPNIIYDIFARVGGGQIEPHAKKITCLRKTHPKYKIDCESPEYDIVNPDLQGTCETMVVVNQNHTIFDHIWCRRANHIHGQHSGLGMKYAMVNHAIVVKGEHVTMFGVFAEHTLKEQIIWEGDYGKLYFQQTTFPSDVRGGWDYPATRVTGRHFKGSGMGAYSFFSKEHNAGHDPPKVTTAFLVFNKDDEEVAATAKIESCFTVFLDAQGGVGSIQSVLNGRGPPSDASNVSKPQWCGTLCRDNICKCQFEHSRWCDDVDE